MSERREPEEQKKPANEKSEPKKDEGKGLKYVFKIAPADPKNTLNFEDVADK